MRHSGGKTLVVALAVVGVALILVILWDAFETMVLPRRVTRKFRLTRLYYRNIWRLWLKVVSALMKGKQQETFLSFFGPLSLLLLLVIWATGLISGFALVNWGASTPIRTPDGTAGFITYLYLSGTTFFTLGLGDVAPVGPLARMLTVVEAGLGFGFLALVIGYLPALNQSFSRREVNIVLLDARAGSPPTASELLLRRCRGTDSAEARLQYLTDGERWAAELLESHLSYPVLAYFRSQHDNQSWLAALTVILDTSAFVIAALEEPCSRQARLTFAMARHAIVDLALVFNRPPLKPPVERLSPQAFAQLRKTFADEGLPIKEGGEVEQELSELRRLYEPYVNSLSQHFRLSVPPWHLESKQRDNWMTSAWDRGVKAAKVAGFEEEKEHF